MERFLTELRTEGFRYGLMLLFALALALLSLLLNDGRASRGFELLAAGGALVLALVTSGLAAERRRALGTLFALLVAIGTVAVVAGVPSVTVTLAATAALLASAVAAVGGGLVRLVVERGVVMQAVFGAVAVYMLVGLCFAYVIGALATGGSEFYFSEGTDGTQSDRTYFSFTALTTTGFGDYTAATQLGRSLTVLEMLLGQLYLVTVIAMLVGNLRRGPGSDAR